MRGQRIFRGDSASSEGTAHLQRGQRSSRGDSASSEGTAHHLISHESEVDGRHLGLDADGPTVLGGRSDGTA
jgi:hypothetical protein